MKELLGIVSLLFIMDNAISQSQDLIIDITNPKYIAPPPEQMLNASALKSAIRTTELAGNALVPLISKLKSDAAKLDAELVKTESDYLLDFDSYKIKIEPWKQKFQPYKTDFDKWEKEEEVFEMEVKEYNRRAKINNDLPPEKRDPAEVSWGNNEKTRLEFRKKQLNQWKGGLDQWKKNLDSARAPYDKLWLALEAKRKNLVAKMEEVLRIKLRLEKAYSQLELCEDYGKRAASVAKAKGWGTYKVEKDFFGTLKIVPSMEELNGWAEKMKDWSGKGWNY